MTTPSSNQKLFARLNRDSKTQVVNFNEDNLFYLGNWHDSFPRSLILDPLLQCTDKCVYQLLRTYITATGASRMPSYEEIGRYLNISRGTVSKSLHILRATGWITLCNAVRDQSNGRFRGNLYAIHDEAIGVQEAAQLDGGYIEALEQMNAKHPHHRVRQVAHSILQSIRQGLDEDASEVPGNLNRLMNRFLSGHKPRIVDRAEKDRVQILDAVKNRVQNLHSDQAQVQKLDSGVNIEEKQKDSIQVQNMDSVNQLRSSSSSKNNKKTTTTTSSQVGEIQTGGQSTGESMAMDPNLIWPGKLLPDEKWLAWQVLKKCPSEVRQDLLDEIGARTRPSSTSPIKNVIGWLGWAHKALLAGEVSPITSNAFIYRKQREQANELERQSKTSIRPFNASSGIVRSTPERKAHFKNNMASVKAALKNHSQDL